MLAILVTVLVGVVGGIAVGMQSPIAGSMSERVGGTASSFIIHTSGAICSGLLLLARGGEQIANWGRLSWYMLGSGGLGVVLYLTLSYTLPRLGATSAVTLIIIGQLLVGIVSDQFGLVGIALRPVDALRVAGAALVLGGAYLILR